MSERIVGFNTQFLQQCRSFFLMIRKPMDVFQTCFITLVSLVYLKRQESKNDNFTTTAPMGVPLRVRVELSFS